jgi:hypothetical protein
MCIEMGDFTPGSMPDGAGVDGIATGVISAVPGQIISVLHAQIAGAGLTLSADFPNAGSTLQDVALIDDGVVVASYEQVDQPIIVIGGPILEPPILEFAPKPGEFPYPFEAGGTFTFLHDVSVTLMGPQGPITADQVVFRPSTALLYDHVSAVDVIAHMTPSFAIAGELVAKFGHAHRALGDARFMLGPDAIAVEQLVDLEGSDGVAIQVTDPGPVFTLELAPLGQQPEGSFCDFTFENIETEGSSTARITDVGPYLSIYDGDLSQLVVQLYLDEVLQAEAQVQGPSEVARVMDEMAWPVGVSGYANLPGYGNGWDFSAPVPVQIGGGPSMPGDRILVVETGAPAGAGLVTSVELTAALDSPLVIINEQVETTPCSGDIDGDGSVGVTDFLAILAAWGPCPDPCPPSCPADLDGDCEVGVTDFLALLAVWGECP